MRDAMMRQRWAAMAAGLLALPGAGCSDDDGGSGRSVVDEATVLYDLASERVRVALPGAIADGQEIRMGVRRGDFGVLDCVTGDAELERIDTSSTVVTLGNRKGATYEGPEAPAAMLEPFFDSDWLEEPTPEMLDRIAGGTDPIVDLCLYDVDGSVLVQLETDLGKARDNAGKLGKADGEDYTAPFASVVTYAEECVSELGEIPFFEKLGEGDYSTYSCLDSPKIPMTVTDENGVVTHPDEQVQQCDRPQYIYSLCEPGPRVNRRINDEGTHWVVLCRKSIGGWESDQFNDIAMVGHNPHTGKTCFFQNALYSKKDGGNVPHPADKEKSKNLWSGIQGALGSGIECTRCHDADPMIHTPWITQAKMAEEGPRKGDPVIPQMGVDEDFGLGYNDAPYSIVGLERQGWTMHPQIVDPRAKACTRCHRMGMGRWLSWSDRIAGTERRWNEITTPAYLTFQNKQWMPPDLEGLDDNNWADSDFAKALDFIRSCNDPGGPECETAPIPSDSYVDAGETGGPVAELEDADLAVKALQQLGANVADRTDRCAECHSLTRGSIKQWSLDTKKARSKCLDATGLTAEQKLDCFRHDPEDKGSPYVAEKLGLYAAGAHLREFRALFKEAYPTTWGVELSKFRRRIGMPKGNHPKMSQYEFDLVEEWLNRDLAELDTVLPEPPPPQTCEESLGGELQAMIDARRFDGWEAANADEGIEMFGCAGAVDPLDCLSDLPSAKEKDYGATWEREGTLRILKELGFKTFFWMRSSADGRFVGNGGRGDGLPEGARSVISDLVTGFDIGVDAAYDPGFFPDNKAWVFQGTPVGAGFCAQSLLERNPGLIKFDEPECVGVAGISLYQHVGSALGGGDYFVVNSQFVSDNGGHRTTLKDPAARFGAGARIKMTPMIFDGSTFSALPAVKLDTPYEGDTVISPSSQLIAGRLAGPDSRQIGYVFRRVDARKGDTTYTIQVPEVGRLCMKGTKPSFSYDEQFIVTHHYVEEEDFAEYGFASAEDEGWKALREKGAADIWLGDLRTGAKIRITNMAPGQYALFPHFRSDGWIYFLVRDTNAGREYVVAADAALHIKSE